MRKLTLALIVFIAFLQSSLSQTASIKGTVIDTAEKKNLVNSVVSVLRKSDSVLIKFTRTDASGNFRLQKLPEGKYFILVTHPNYADYFSDVELKDTSALVFGKVPMITKAQLLEEVVVRQRLGAVRQRGDTTEFIADSFKVAANANVEDLLRRLPGFQIDKDGKITAQGEQVQKVLVDGEEFFGNDPTIATQNIRADNVEKVQVYDKKSDQAAFTGIDDGQKTKTINLKLKENKKNGYFGKATLGGGLKDKFANQAMINSFKGKRKVAAFGTMANTGQTGLNWQDQSNYGGGGAELIEMDDGGAAMIMGGGGDEFGGGGGYYGEGLPTGWSAGLHYSNKYNEAKHSLNGSYRFNKLNTIGGGTTTSQFLSDDTAFFRNERGNNYQQRIRNMVTGVYELQIDSFSTLKVTANGSVGKSNQFNTNFSESLSEEGSRVNMSDRSSSASGENQNLTTTALYRKKFRKLGRTISLNLNQVYQSRTTDGFLLSDNRYYDAGGILILQDSIDQQKKNDNHSLTLAGKLAYTEPLSKYIFMEVSYSLSSSTSQNERITLANLNGKYENFIDTLSTNYQFNVLTNRGGLSFRVNKKKYNLSVGSDVSNSDFRQKDLFQDTVLNYSYLNLFPRANFNYTIKPQTRLGLRYNGSTRQPSIDQLQPLRDNTDPLNVYRGNPGLKQEFRHNFGLNFSDFKVLNNRNIWLSANFTTISNAIGTSEFLDPTLGKRIYQPVNVKGNYSMSAYANYYFKIKNTDFNIGFSMDGNYNINNGIVNNVLNRNKNSRIGGGLSLNYFKEKKFRMNMYSSIGRNVSESSIRKELATKYWSASFYPNMVLTLPAKIELGTDASIDLREKTALFDQNRNVIKWNASISKKFLKGESGVLKFEIRDILDQNIGFNRNIQGNNITERTYDTLRRFWLLSFTWNFSKNGKAPQ